MSVLGEFLDTHAPVREPAYRPLAAIDDEERARLKERIGGEENYAADILQQLIIEDPEDTEYKKALVSAIVSAEYAGIDAFGRNVARWGDLTDVPGELVHAMVRQTYDEVRHARLGTELLEDEYGGTLGDYPDTLAGMAQAEQDEAQEAQAQRVMNLPPVASLSIVNVTIEGAALKLFSGVSNLGKKIDDRMMEHVYDYNWADEVVHVSIGDWFVKKLSEDNPVNEAIALQTQAMTESQREQPTRNVSEHVRQEIVEFMKGETERATSVLVGPVSGGYEPDR